MITEEGRQTIVDDIKRAELAESIGFTDTVRAAKLQRGKDLTYLDFSNCDFSRQDLGEFNFEGCIFTGANFSKAKISKAHFHDAVLDLKAMSEADDWELFARTLQAPDFALALTRDRTQIYARRQGLILDEPAIAAYRGPARRKAVVAIGAEAQRAKESGTAALKYTSPAAEQGSNDATVLMELLDHSIQRTLDQYATPPDLVLVSAAAWMNSKQRSAIHELIKAAGIAEVRIIDEAISKGFGLGISVEAPVATMLLEIGDTDTTILIYYAGEAQISQSIGVGAETFVSVIKEYCKNSHGIEISRDESISLLRELVEWLSPVSPSKDKVTVIGTSLKTGFRESRHIWKQDSEQILEPAVSLLAEKVRGILSKLSPDLVDEIAQNRAVMFDGKMMLSGVEALVSKYLRIPVHYSLRFGNLEIAGCSHILDNWADLKGLLKFADD